MSETFIVTERRGPVLLIALARPDKLNAMHPEMVRQLARAYTELDTNKSLRVGVLHAQGRYFTSGLDFAAVVKSLPQQLLNPMVPRFGVDPWGAQRRACRKPVISAVEGACYTLGIELILNGQVTVAGENATFTQAEITRGIFPFGGGTVRWPLAVGVNNAYLHLLTADEFGADEAFRIGLVQKVVPAGQALDEALRIAGRIAQNAPLGVQATMASVRRMQSKGAQSALSRLLPTFLRLMLTKDAKRGVEAFRTRKPAEFQGD